MRPEVGQIYGYRRRIRTPGEPVIPALVVKLGPSRSKQVKVRWQTGEFEGLEEWISHIYLVCHWDESSAFISDELNLSKVIVESSPPINPREQDAVDETFDALETTFYTEFSSSKKATLTINDFPETVITFNLNPQMLLSEPFAFIDRHGCFHATYQTAKKIALELCTQFPDRILDYAKKELKKQSEADRSAEYIYSEGWPRGQKAQEFAELRRREQQEIIQILCEWCGKEHEKYVDNLNELRYELERLRSILGRTLDWMRDTAKLQDARWLRMKYLALYKELSGTRPPDIEKHKKRVTQNKN